MDRRHHYAAGKLEDLSIHRVQAPTSSACVGDLHLIDVAISKLDAAARKHPADMIRFSEE
jgi:hypothetical protein